MTPFVQDADFTLWNGDCLDVLRSLEAGSAHCCVTSPPYWGLRDYGHDDQLGLEATPDEYVARMVAVFREVRRVLRDDGTLWLNLGSSYMSDPGKGGSGPNGKNEGRWSYGRAARRDARPSDTPYTELLGSPDPDSACPDLCGECEAALSLRTADTGQPRAESPPLVSLTDRDSEHQDSEPTPLAASPRDAPASTIQLSEQPPQDQCCHCANCGACLSVLRSSSRDARLCVRKESRTNGTSLPASGDRNQGTDAGGMAWLNYTSRLKAKDLVPIPWMVAMALQADGWYLRSDVIWSKPNPMPESVTDRPTKSHEYVFLLSKSPRYFFDQEAVREPAEWARWGDQTTPKHNGTDTGSGWIKPRTKSEIGRTWGDRKENGAPMRHGLDGAAAHGEGGFATPEQGRNVRSVWEIATQPYAEAHFATFPLELPRRCIAAGCPAGGTVLDPFMGSGTTALVARNLGRNSIGIELNADYCALAAKRLSQQSLLAGDAA